MRHDFNGFRPSTTNWDIKCRKSSFTFLWVYWYNPDEKMRKGFVQSVCAFIWLAAACAMIPHRFCLVRPEDITIDFFPK